ncbi:MAG: type I DNA topoisomerase [Muribaculaceae bacterium]|nr:type I DNA topoisomerase [Muribaculaceae bacterium]
MSKNLVIVESPAKAKTIEKFLGKDFKVVSSHGHIRDLKKSNLSVNVEKGFAPIYEIPADKKQLVSELKKAAKEADVVWLASDEDREGEAIAWHLAEVLGLDIATTRRIVFHEITKNAILHAIENPRTIDLNRVDAQQARRVLDRIVGFELSPVLWRKIKPALSAGRVQSVAVRLIADRENEIEEFNSTPYYRVTGNFMTPGGVTVTAELNKRLPDRFAAVEFLEKCKKSSFEIIDVTKKPLKKSPAPPFTTSTLQQEASRKLGFSVAQTMRVAQKLYEDGLITYMRTDSLNLSDTALKAISVEISKAYGVKYVKKHIYHTSSKGAQEAHEAIRPTYFDRHSILGTPQEQKLYDLIWKRAVASQMADALLEKTTITVKASEVNDDSMLFHIEGETVTFDGFLKVYLEGNDEDEKTSEYKTLPLVEIGEILVPGTITASERFTQHPPRYTEASLVKKLEELGIGRPSTYAPTIQNIIDRQYVERGTKEGVKRDYNVLVLENQKIKSTQKSEMTGAEKGKLVPTDTGRIVNAYLTEKFPDILDYNFTANIEEKIDEIAAGQHAWNDEIGKFYKDFHPAVEDALTTRTEHKVGERLIGQDPSTGEPVYVKIGRFGPMVQIGDTDKDTKPRFASLLKGQSMATLTLEEALKLFEFPRKLGELDGHEISVAVGRFGPYVKWDKLNASVPKDIQPSELTLEQAVQLIRDKKDAESKRVIKSFDQDDIKILNGRYGPYIAQGKNNFKIPKTVTDPSSLTLEEVKEIIATPPTTKRSTRSRK